MLPVYALWLILGLLLVISEFVVPGLIAVFFGVGALVVGLLTLFGITDTLASQLLMFSVFSVTALFGSRKHFQRWMKGSISDQGDGDLLGNSMGARVTVLTDFHQGAGHVQLRGAKWDAESAEPLKAGDVAWVVGNRGIVLLISTTPK
jgi:inner membrane protein